MKHKWLIDRIERLFLQRLWSKVLFYFYIGLFDTSYLLVLCTSKNSYYYYLYFCRVIRFSTLDWLSLLSSSNYIVVVIKSRKPTKFFVNAQPKQTYIINIREWQFVNFFCYEFVSFQRYACCSPTYWTDNFSFNKIRNKNI